MADSPQSLPPVLPDRPPPDRPPPDRQREHQANERTFLAWLRTSISLIGFGFAIARFSLFLRQLQATQDPRSSIPIHSLLNAENLGLMLVIFGVIMIGLSAWRYNSVLSQIEQGSYRPNRWLVGLIAAVVGLFGVLSIPLVLRQNRDQTPGSLPNLSLPNPREW